MPYGNFFQIDSSTIHQAGQASGVRPCGLNAEICRFIYESVEISCRERAIFNATHNAANVFLTRHLPRHATIACYKLTRDLAHKGTDILLALDAAGNPYAADIHGSTAFSGKCATTINHAAHQSLNGEILNLCIILESGKQSHIAVIFAIVATLI